MKARIFIGPPETGKSRMAKLISEYRGADYTAMFDGRELHKDMSLFVVKAQCNLVIIDDCPIGFDYDYILGVFESYKLTCPFDMIVTTNHLEKKCYESRNFEKNFELIGFPLGPVSKPSFFELPKMTSKATSSNKTIGIKIRIKL